MLRNTYSRSCSHGIIFSLHLSLSALVFAAVVALHRLATHNIRQYSDSISLLHIGKTGLKFLWEKPRSYCSWKLQQSRQVCGMCCAMLNLPITVTPLAMCRLTLWAMVPFFGDLAQLIIPEVNIAEYFPRWGIGGRREGSGTKLIDICVPARSVKSATLQLVPGPSMFKSFWVLNRNKGNRATETSGEVPGGKPRLFFHSKPLAALRPVLRSSAAWRLKSRAKPIGTLAEADTQAIY